MIDFKSLLPHPALIRQSARLALTALTLSASACGTMPGRQARLATPANTGRQVASRQAVPAAQAVARGQSSSAVIPASANPYEAPYQIQPVSAEARLQIGPHGECPHGCPSGDQCPSCPSSCCGPEDQYPDEYLCDGGDREQPVHYDDYGMLGLETQDTVAEFRDGKGKRRVRRSNEVCIYAPRFASVSVVSGAIEDASRDRPNQHIAETRQNIVHQPDVVIAAEQNEMAERIFAKVRPTVLLNADGAFDVTLPVAPVAVVNELVPLTYFGFLNSYEAKQVDEPWLAMQIQSAQVWTRDQNPVIVAKDDAVQIVESRFRVEELAGTDVKGPGNLKIVKLADRKLAAQDDEITFTIRYQNQGDSPVTDVTIVDNLTPRLEYLEGSQTNDRASRFEAIDNGEGSVILRWELDEPLPARTTGVISFKVQVR